MLLINGINDRSLKNCHHYYYYYHYYYLYLNSINLLKAIAATKTSKYQPRLFLKTTWSIYTEWL